MKPISKLKLEDKEVNHADTNARPDKNYSSKLSKEEYLELIAEQQEQH